MRTSWLWLGGAAFLAPTAASAADQLKFGKAPEWVVPQAIPNGDSKLANAPIAILLTDTQARFVPGKTTTYSEVAMKLQTPEGLAAGNLSIPWNPATDTITVNKLEIHRGGQVIDVLKSGQTFTTLRRETNLEAAMFDGMLTANIQPEGLQQGDIIDLATTTEHVDPVMSSHVEGNFGELAPVPVQLSHIHIDWPAALPLKVQATGFAIPQRERNGLKVIDVTQRNVEPVVPPKNAPVRFSLSRLGEATDFASWADVAALMQPLFKKAEAIPATGPLHDEVEKIRASGADPKVRAAAALQLVQDRVRYVALSMGQGSYVPADAETTWSRRYGDCKAKTALLLGILHSIGIEAEPILVQSRIGDVLSDRLPLLSYFDHVLVRAHIGGKTYYLDGTKSGDSDLDAIEVPFFEWGLPVTANAKLVAMVPPPRQSPSQERHIDVDASAGVYAPASIIITELYRGDGTPELNNGYAALTTAQKDEVLRREAVSFFDGMDVKSTSFQFDKAKREFTISIKGTAKLSWDDGWFRIPTSSIAFDPDWARPAGPLHDAPIAVSHPRYVLDVATLKLPRGFAAKQELSAPIHETLAGVEYSRTETLSGDTIRVESSERSLTPEISYKEALAAAPRLKKLNDDDVFLSSSVQYKASESDLAAVLTSKPSSTDEYIQRGNLFLDSAKYDEAISDFTEALKLEPKNLTALADRGIAHVWKHQYDLAESDLASVLRMDPANAIALRARGLMSENRGKLSEAIDFYSKSLAADPKNDFALIHRAYARASLGDTTGALSDYDNASQSLADQPANLLYRASFETIIGRLDDAKKDLAVAAAKSPNLPGLALARGMLAEKNGDYKAASKAFTDELREQPGNADILMRRAATYYSLGEKEKALADTDAALKAGYKSADVRLLRANILFRQGNREGTAREAELAMSEHTDSEYAFVMAGKTYARLGMTKEALKAFDRAIEINPAPYVYVNRAQVRPASDVEGQLADYEAALKLEPNQQEALAGKADLLAHQGKKTEAAPIYEKLAQLLSSDRDSDTERALLLYKAGHVDQAAKLFAQARTNAQSSGALNNLCWTKATAGIFLDSALQDCRDALKQRPQAGGYLDSLGMVLLKLGKLDEALRVYNDAIAHGAGANSLMGRAIVYARKGDRAHAKADAAAAQKLWSDAEAVFARDYQLTFELP